MREFTNLESAKYCSYCENIYGPPCQFEFRIFLRIACAITYTVKISTTILYKPPYYGFNTVNVKVAMTVHHPEYLAFKALT